MNDSLKEWIGVIIIIPIIVAVYLYFNNPNFASFIKKSIDEPPYVSIRQDSLVIEDFHWNIGFIGFNQVAGDFEGLNKKVYKALKNKSGNYKVVLEYNTKDKFGNPQVNTSLYGNIDADDLNKYQSAEYWAKDKGMYRIIIPDNKPEPNESDNAPVYFPDELHAPNTVNTPSSNDTKVTETQKTFIINNAYNKTWLYYERRNGHFTHIEPQSNDYQEFVEYWNIVKRDIKDIKIDILAESVIVTLDMINGQNSKFELQSILGNALYGVQNGNTQLLFMIAPGGSGAIQMIEGDRAMAIFTD